MNSKWSCLPIGTARDMRRSPSSTVFGRLSLLVLCVVFLSSCTSGIGPHERLGWYVPYVPATLVIEQFYGSPRPAMDHDYLWKIKIEETDEFKTFWQQMSSAPPNSYEASSYDNIMILPAHPIWWKEWDFQNGLLFKHRMFVIGSNGSERANVFALYVVETGYVYIQAF